MHKLLINKHINMELKDNNTESCKLISDLVVGGYDITGNNGKGDSINFMMTNKPNWFHRKFSKIFFGWDWFDKN